jgi:hypothetical protein
MVISLVTPLIYSFTFFNGFAGQIKPTDYPSDWYEINNFLNEDEQDFKILFFPWHGYMNFKWVNNTDKRIANPARNFFDKEVISGTTVEIGGIYRQDNAPEQLYIDNLLEKMKSMNRKTTNAKKITNFGELVSILNIKYVILAKETDYRQYLFLLKQKDLELIKETKTLYVFKNKNEVTKIYQTNDINNINSDKEEIEYQKRNPVNYKLGKINNKYKYLIFTEPYSEDWKLDGRNSIKAYGVINGFENKGKEIIFERFYNINLPSYFISIITFVILIGIYFDIDKKIKKTLFFLKVERETTQPEIK